MKIGSRIPRPAVWLSLVLSMAALLAGCANVAFDHGTTALEEKSLVFGRIVLDRGEGPEVVSTMATPVVIRNLETADEPRLLTQPMEKDGSFHWTLAPGRYQVSLILNRFADGYRSYAFHVPKARGAHYFGDLTLRGNKRFDTIGGANIRNVRAEFRDAFGDAVARLRQRNPQLRDVPVARLDLHDMTRPEQRASAYRDMLEEARICCRGLPEADFRPLEPGGARSYRIGPESPVLEFPAGRSRFLALKLPATPPPYTVTLRSLARTSNLGQDRVYVFAPAVMLLDRDFQPVALHERGLFGAAPASLMPPRGASLLADLRIDGQTASARYLVLYTTPGILGQTLANARPGAIAVAGGAMPTGRTVSLVMEPALHGEIEVTVTPE